LANEDAATFECGDGGEFFRGGDTGRSNHSVTGNDAVARQHQGSFDINQRRIHRLQQNAGVCFRAIGCSRIKAFDFAGGGHATHYCAEFQYLASSNGDLLAVVKQTIFFVFQKIAEIEGVLEWRPCVTPYR
jgi:hypothetical protein